MVEVVVVVVVVDEDKDKDMDMDKDTTPALPALRPRAAEAGDGALDGWKRSHHGGGGLARRLLSLATLPLRNRRQRQEKTQEKMPLSSFESSCPSRGGRRRSPHTF